METYRFGLYRRKQRLEEEKIRFIYITVDHNTALYVFLNFRLRAGTIDISRYISQWMIV